MLNNWIIVKLDLQFELSDLVWYAINRVICQIQDGEAGDEEQRSGEGPESIAW